MAPYKKGDSEKHWKIQKRATKNQQKIYLMFTLFETLSYEDKLKSCNLTTLHYRCLRGDMIETIY